MNPFIVFWLAFEKEMEIRRQIEIKNKNYRDNDQPAQISRQNSYTQPVPFGYYFPGSSH